MTPLKTGDIVTSKGDGLEWCGVVADRPVASLRDDHMSGRVFIERLGPNSVAGTFTHYDRKCVGIDWPDLIRPLTDPEILALGAFLCTGDAGAEWDFFRDGSILLGPDWLLRETALDLDVWTITKKGSQDALYIGTAPTDRARRLEACKALIRHACEVK